jgi:branched-chain amino acid transport system substrate-binding protein
VRRVLALGASIALLAGVACGPERSPIRIGAVYPLSGTQGPGGLEEFRGVALAVELANADGGIRGRPVELVPIDVASADAAPAAISRLASQGIELVLGSYGSTISAPAASAAAGRGMLFWETGAVGEMSGAAPGRSFFRMAPSGAVLGRNAIAFVGDEYAPLLGTDPDELRFAVTLVDDAYGRAVAGGALEEIRARGYRLAGTFAYDPRSVDMEGLVSDLAASDPDVLFVSAYLEDAVAMRREIVRRGLELVVGIGTSSSYCLPEFGAMLGEEALGMFASDKPSSDAVNRDGLTPQGRALFERATAAYADRFGAPMSAAALAGFSSAWALVHEVLPAAGEISPAAAAAAANRATLPEGSLPNGSGLRFGAPGTARGGTNLLASSVVWQWRASGEHVVVWPSRWATHELVEIDPLP